MNKQKGTSMIKRPIFRWVFLVIVFLLAVGALGIGINNSESETSKIHGTNIKSIKVVIDDNYPPYSFRDESGNLVGISIDQWKLWEKQTGIHVEITGMNWSTALESMEADEFDVIDTIFYNKARAQVFDYSKPYATIDVPIYFNNRISGITNARTARGFRVAVKSGDAVINILQENGVQNLVYYDNYQAIVEAAANQDVNVFAIDRPPADYYLYMYSIQNDFNSTNPLYSGQFHRAVLKGNTEVLSVVDGGFASISAPEYALINRKYLGIPAADKAILKYGAAIIGGILLVLLFLLVWNRTLQNQVKQRTKTLAENESRYRDLFEESPISLWEEDFSEVVDYLHELMQKHGEDIHHYLAKHPGEIFMCFGKIRVLDINKATLDLFKANTKEQMLGSLREVMKDTPIDTLAIELEKIAHKATSYSWDGINTNLVGEKIYIRLHWAVEPGHEERMDKVVLSLVDMTAIKKAELDTKQIKNRLDMAVKAARVGVWEWDITGDRLIWDDRMYELYGQVKGIFKPVYKSWSDCLFFDDKKPMDSLLLDALKGKKEYETVFRVLHPDESIHHIKAFGQVIRDKDDKPISMVGINFDISQTMEFARIQNLISKTQLRIAHAESTDEVRRIVAEDILKITGKTIVCVSCVNDEEQTIQIKELNCDRSIQEVLGKKWEVEAKKVHFKISEMTKEDLRLFRSEKFEKYRFGLYKLSTKKIPREVCDRIEQELGLSYLYKIGFIFDGRHLGGLTIASAKDLLPLSASIETVMNLATLALKRITSEQNLQKSEEQFHSLFNQSPIGIALSDADTRFISTNPAFCRMVGYNEDEIQNLSFRQITYPDDIEAVTNQMKRLKSGESDLFMIEKRYIRKDQSVIWGAVTVKALRAEEGRIMGYLAMVEDITDRKKSEVLLAEERHKVKTLMDNVPDSVYYKDLNGRFTGANLATARKFGCKSPSELIGKSDHDFFSKELAEIADKEETEIIRTGTPIIGEEEMEEWPDKPPRWVSKTKMALYDENGKVSGTFGVIRDITEHKQQEDEIRQLAADLEKKVENRTKEIKLKNQELEAFTYSVSHDLKAPLRGISGYADLLLTDHSRQLDDEGKDYLVKLIRSSQQLSQLIEDLLMYSRLERKPFTYEELKVADIVNLLVEQEYEKIKKQHVRMHIDLDNETINSSHELLMQIIKSYLDNALKFSSKVENPKIWITYKNQGATSLLSIKDNGIGFDNKFKDKIFEVFQRLNTTDVFEGTGIGLALVNRAAAMLGYRVWAEGKPGKGATFFLEVTK
jgi:PAS domain S-box-containing protein